ncbi:cob(I)yrinic acid a,c-diamide adenosyltransferase [Fulvivirga sedimenti]|uniref:Corrinoid adenosyltransferase n=1 Tax=Fulvivirga sedimenti TaxID=2879465 RepID=A0A9X1L1A7_9BACT|nr:cob(I)yrinic acid a,c-diamide adenosyltransferase [Fulvivirga sedimenti]MCA6078032.1 cob(I)yrinic acid a,c-diamide adenosyltransferase [Fulvivirga sedimenti]
MKIYTKTGDTGTTGLFGGKRVQKSDVRIEAYGTVDELNSHLGLLRDLSVNKSREDLIVRIQNNLFVIGSMLAAEPGNEKVKVPAISAADVAELEQAIDSLEENLPPMKNFILPGGHQDVSFCHIARCVCRRAERRVVHLFHEEPGDEIIVHYLNRLSDYLFVLSREMSRSLGAKETPWISRG